MFSAAPSTTLEERLGYHFVEPGLLVHALTHRSWCAEHPGDESNERLEFLGDAVLGVVVTDHLFSAFPDLPEGQLAKARAAVVSSTTLAEVGRELGVGLDLRLGKGEDASGGREKASILADAVEAVLGAMYLDGGVEPVRRLVLEQLSERIDQAAERPGDKDYKTRLQEVAAHDGFTPPVYALTESGPDHHKRFHATVAVGGERLGAGTGTSKKEAEQKAARAAYERRSAQDGVRDDV
ncbi:MAG: ribonuclease III [Actinomycetota bacterium]|nr:ribonuclease III [Acidimicrobiaceae bacterium]MEC7403363.1 ribonuclease III [Actinomycetota bacterium]MEC7673371.1 ribonuclease III [Actinomycetota bacterium]MEC8687598.1 ribonuclease III [Actinomycetota bacterium]